MNPQRTAAPGRPAKHAISVTRRTSTKGKAKQQRIDLRPVEPALIVTAGGGTRGGLHAYAGDRPDVNQFRAAIGTLLDRRQPTTSLIERPRDRARRLAAFQITPTCSPWHPG